VFGFCDLLIKMFLSFFLFGDSGAKLRIVNSAVAIGSRIMTARSEARLFSLVFSLSLPYIFIFNASRAE